MPTVETRTFRRECGEPQFGASRQMSESHLRNLKERGLLLPRQGGRQVGSCAGLSHTQSILGHRQLEGRPSWTGNKTSVQGSRTHGWKFGCLAVMGTPRASTLDLQIPFFSQSGLLGKMAISRPGLGKVNPGYFVPETINLPKANQGPVTRVLDLV